MNTREKIELIKKNAEEIMTEEDLVKLIKDGEKIKHYIGFEISGKIHIGTGIMCMSKVKDFQDAGVDCSIFLADWHSWINDKLGGDIDTIKRVAGGYFKEGLKASLKCVGGDPSKVKFILGSDLYHNNDEYWRTVIDVSKNTSLSRMQRSITIAGRKEGESVDFAKMIYPPMQVADIFIQGLNLPHAGLDQRKAQVIARDVALKLKISPLKNKKGEQIKPIAVHHHLILGLGKPPVWPVPKDNLQDLWSALKMSKSKPNTCIFITDEPKEIEKKIADAFCPEGETEFNPILDWTKYLLFGQKDFILKVERPDKFGGNIKYNSFEKVKESFGNKKLHPMDLKKAVARDIIKLLEPARKHFSSPKMKKLKEEMDKLVVTR